MSLIWKEFLEGPNVLDRIGAHECGGGLVEVTCDVQKGGGECLVSCQPGIPQITAKII